MSHVRVSWWRGVSTSGRPAPFSPAGVKVSSVTGVSTSPLLRYEVSGESVESENSCQFVSNVAYGRSLEQRVCPGSVEKSSSVVRVVVMDVRREQ